MHPLASRVASLSSALLFASTAVLAQVQSLPPEGLAQIDAYTAEKLNRTPAEAKLSSQLLYAMRTLAGQPAVPGLPGPIPGVQQFIADRVAGDHTVQVTIQGDINSSLLAAIAATGGVQVDPYPQFGRVTARLPISSLLVVAARADVRSIRPLDRPQTNRYIPPKDERGTIPPAAIAQGIPNGPIANSGTSQGFHAHGADLAVATGIDGTGVKICVLSDGVDSLATLQGAGELPAVDVVSGQAGSGDEGTAMLQIVHDMAPNATLGFATAFTSDVSFAANIVALRNAPHNCDIIVDDVTYFEEGAFQDGPIAQSVNTVTAAGALYFSSAANSGNLTHAVLAGTWEGDFVAAGPTGLGRGGTLHSFGAATYDTLTSFGSVVILEWSDPLGASNNDYDLYILNAAGTAVLTSSTTTQNGTQDPVEGVQCDFVVCPANARVVVVLFSGVKRALRVDTERGTMTIVTDGNTFGHNAAASAFTAAATDVANAGGGLYTGGAADPVENYSSDGPRKIFYNPDGTTITPGNVLFGTNGGTTLAKVDLTASDCVHSFVNGFDPFCGTSSAAPHSAAIAGLIKSAKLTATNAQITTALLNSALDIEAVGRDRDSGVGIVMAPAAVRGVLNTLVVGTSFAPTPIAVGATSVLTITLQNTNAVALKGVVFTDTYPANVVNAGLPNANITGAGCTGSLAASGGGNTLALTVGVVPANTTCSYKVTVTSATGGTYMNSTGAVTTPIALNSAAASASLTVGFPSEPCGTGSYPFPYTDVASITNPFCPGIMEAYVTGVSKGTTPTTFSPNNTVTRVQMTTFLQRSLDQGLTRASPRAALNQWGAPQSINSMQTVAVGGAPFLCAADGQNIWSSAGSQVVEVRAGTGKVQGTWTGATNSEAVLVAAGRVFVTSFTAPGNLYLIDPSQPPGAVTSAASNLGNDPIGIAFDGTNLWTANVGSPGSISIITPQPATPYPVNTISTGFSGPAGVLYDGTHIWVTDQNAGTLLKLDAAGTIVQTVAVGALPQTAVFDGTNIWVPNSGSNSITVVQASTGNVVATINADASNKLNAPTSASFDGERILVANYTGNSVTVFKAADLSFIANVTTGAATHPNGACSDGVNFWVPLQGTGKLLRF
jgi:hypothetical protein